MFTRRLHPLFRKAVTVLTVFTVAALTLGFTASVQKSSVQAATGPVDVCLPCGGAGGTLTGIINTYYPATALTGANNSTLANATSVILGASRGNATPISTGDVLLVMQMQDTETDNSTNSSSSGAPLSNGYNSTGVYDYVTATNSVGLGGGTVTFTPGLAHIYTNADPAGTKGQRRFQVIRVPQYSSATLGANLTASTWNGSTGGVFALKVCGPLDLGSGLVDVTGTGFRGGGGEIYTGQNTFDPTSTYRYPSTDQVGASKGESDAGTPRFVFDTGNVIDNTAEGYPNGSYGAGVASLGGGGANDGNVSGVGNNDLSSGGGGGANAGDGGRGGNSNSTSAITGGRADADTFNPLSPTDLPLGGGGGAGNINQATSDPFYSNGAGSSGGGGGGIILIDAQTTTGTGTMKANGANAPAVANPVTFAGGGGGGAGGDIIVRTASTGTVSGITADAIGGDGGSTNVAATLNSFNDEYGPGGGGGGGALFFTTPLTPGLFSVAGGNSGVTTSSGDPYGASTGGAGRYLHGPSGIIPFDQCTPTPTPTSTSTSTSTSTGTATASNTATGTDTASVTNTASVTDTATASNTASNTATNTASNTATSTNTASNTATFTATASDTASATNTASNTATFTATASNTASVTNTATNTASVTNTASNTATNTASVTPSLTNTASNTASITNTPSQTASATNTASITPSLTNTASNTASVTNTASNTATNTASVTPSLTNTASNTASITNTPSQTASATNTASITPSLTNTASLTASVTNTASNTPTNTASVTPSLTNTASNTASITNTPSQTASATNTASITPSLTNTASNTASVTNTPSVTASNTASITPSVTNTASSTSTNTSVPSNTPSNTSTSTATNKASNTSTATNTASATNTSIASLTNTATQTQSNTPPASNTPSSTSTVTNTSTSTMTGTLATSTSTSTASSTVTGTLPTSTNTSTGTVTAPTITNTSGPVPPTATPTNGTPVILIGDPILAKHSDVTLAQPGSPVHFTLTVTNIGTAPAAGVVVTDPVPSPLILQAASATQGTFSINLATNTVIFNIGTVNPGQVVTLTVSTLVSPSAKPPIDITNSASLNDAAGQTSISSAPIHITAGGLPATGEHPDSNTPVPGVWIALLIAAAVIGFSAVRFLRRRRTIEG